MAADSEPEEDLLRDDRDCLDAFRRGDRRAMARVYEAYLPLVRTVCYHGFGGFKGFFDPVDRDDAVQSIFAAAFEERARRGYDGLQPYSRYLRGIAHNVVRQMLSKRRRFERRPDPPPEGSTRDADEVFVERELCDIMRGFRESVTEPPEPEVLQRYFVEGWSEERLARHLGLTRYRVRKTIARLHERMRKLMKSHGL
ncbi:MAG: RNA polymerase sigma factor [Myxococcota bacterium]